MFCFALALKLSADVFTCCQCRIREALSVRVHRRKNFWRRWRRMTYILPSPCYLMAVWSLFCNVKRACVRAYSVVRVDCVCVCVCACVRLRVCVCVYMCVCTCMFTQSCLVYLVSGKASVFLFDVLPDLVFCMTILNPP